MILYWQNHVAGYVGAHHYLNDSFRIGSQHIGVPPAAVFVYPTGLSIGVTVGDTIPNLTIPLQGLALSSTLGPVWVNSRSGYSSWTEVEDRDTDEDWTETET